MVNYDNTLSCAAIAQLGERQTEDLEVPGSIPGLGILFLAASGRAPLSADSAAKDCRHAIRTFVTEGVFNTRRRLPWRSALFDSYQDAGCYRWPPSLSLPPPLPS